MLCISLLVLYFGSQAQEFRKFKTGIGWGFASPSSNNDVGLFLYLEPGYRITDALLVNIRLESAITLLNADDFESRSYGHGSYTFNAQYYISKNSIRPFAGLGVGLFSIQTYQAEIYQNGGASVSYGYESKPGFYTRAGLDLGHLNLSIDYNFVTTTTIEEIVVVNATHEIVSKKSSNSYVGFRLGVSIGGGKKSSK